MEGIVWYLYIKNWKIMWSDRTWKNKSFGEPIKITLPWYYRMINWVPKLILSENDLQPWDTFVWNRDFKWFYEKKIEAVWWEKLEDTRTDTSKVVDIKNPTEEQLKEAEKELENWDTSWRPY